MAEKEYIEREMVEEFLATSAEGLHGTPLFVDLLLQCRDRVKEMPAADVAPVVHARWITEENTEGYRGDPHCTACKGILDDEAVYGHTPGVDSFYFCPLCGAKMDGATDNNVGGKRKEQDNV